MSRRRKKQGISLATLLIALFIALGQHFGWFSDATQGIVTNQPGLYSIDHFVDGDTIAVDMNGKVENIRFIGIDTPETHKPNTPVQCYGPAAAAYTKNRIGDGKVRLASDSLSTDRDRYDRLLRYVYLTDGTNLNESLVENGYAFYYPYFPFTKSAEFKAAEQSAIAANRGLWANCNPTPTDDGGYKMNEPAS
ncbi:MAG: thermonuclease family protein [Candidatus Saccharimonadales bacterium]